MIMKENIELDLSNIQRAHDEFYENNFFDVKIHCKSIILPAHRYVLSCRSELLAQKLASGVDTLDWDEFEDRTSTALLRWIYTNEIADVTTADQWLDLLHGSHKLELVSLFVICERKLVSQVFDNPTRRFYDIAKKVGAYQLWEKCLELGLNALDDSTYEIRDHLCSSCCSEPLSISDENDREDERLQFNKLTMGCHEFRQFSDIEVATDSANWQAHSHVLKSRSEKFLNECRKAGGRRTMLHAYAFEHKLLRWVYTDSVVIGTPRCYNATNLMQAAWFYDLPTLFERCERVIVESIDIASCAYWHPFAKKYNAATLLKSCNQLISQYYIKSKFSDCSEVTAETEMIFEDLNSTSKMLMCELPSEAFAAEASEGLLKLNDDCLLYILRFVSLVDLASIKCTCKRLSALADQCFRLYGDKSLDIKSDSMFGDVWILKHFGKFIESLNFCSFYERYASRDNIFEMIARYTNNKLKTISLHGWDWGRREGETFEVLKTLLNNVHRIELKYFDCDSIPDKLLNYCENLKEVEIDGETLRLKSDWYLKNPNLTKIAITGLRDAEILKEICKNCTRLECLSVEDIETDTKELIHLSQLASTMKQIKIHAESFFMADELQQFADKTVLNDLTLAYPHMTESLANVLGDFPNLCNLTFEGRLDLDENTSEILSKKLTNIDSLSLHYCDNLTFEVLANMVKNLFDLKRLTLSECEQVECIGSHEYRSLRKIRKLEIFLNREVYESTCELIGNNWLDNINVKSLE